MNAIRWWIGWVFITAAAFAVGHVVLASWHYRAYVSGVNAPPRPANLAYLLMRFVVESAKIGIPAVLAFAVTGGFHARAVRTPWPSGAKPAYVHQCVPDFVGQGRDTATATTVCSCIADELVREFGMEEYSQMMAAQPRRNGTSYDRRLFRVFNSCFRALK